MLIIPLCAYGKWHIETAQYLLASLRSVGNLPDVESRVLIYTDQPGAFDGQETFVISPNFNVVGKHELNIECYRRALSYGHPIVPLSADMICPTGMLAALQKHAATKRLVVCPVIRVDATYLKGVLDHGVFKDGAISLSPRELMALSIDHVHHRQQQMYWPDIGPTNAPTTIFRRSGNTVAARCFHMHPLMVRASPDAKMERGLDWSFVDTIPKEETHIVIDSDETAVVDMSDKGYAWEQTKKPIGPLRGWLLRKTTPRHRWFFEHECYLHSEDVERMPADPAFDRLCEEVRALQ